VKTTKQDACHLPLALATGPRRLVLVLWCSAVNVLAVNVLAEDTITVATGKDGRGRSRITGQILDYTGEGLRVRLSSGREQTLASDRVIEVESSWPRGYTAGDQLFAQRKFEQALGRYQEALGEEQRGWVKRRIMAQCVWCYRNLQRWGQAGDAFLAIYRSDPATQYFASIPLAWTAAHSANSPNERVAASWLADRTSPAASLLGASWLLATNQRDLAQNALRKLSADPDPRIAFLAEAQLWRMRTTTAAPEETARWRERVERMPDDLRSGPYFVLAQSLARHKLHEQAALAALRIPILYSSHRKLAAESLLVAGRELEQLGKLEEAMGLYRELTTDYSGVAAAAARSRLERLQHSTTN
jgi:tetratricopeptide (TPR) repeat protein